jgi:poly(3-hydroxybutyrate) depolymerase
MIGAPGQAVHLVGYSGGAAIAVLLAARRQDVASVRTVAGNLDSEAVNRMHRVSAMPESLNPIDVAPALARIPQIHFISQSDIVVPASIAARFAAAATGCARVVTIVGPSHESGWAEQWPTLLHHIPACSP